MCVIISLLRDPLGIIILLFVLFLLFNNLDYCTKNYSSLPPKKQCHHVMITKMTKLVTSNSKPTQIYYIQKRVLWEGFTN